MSLSAFGWLNDTFVADWVIGSPYIWPTMESIHFVSLCVLMGSLLIVDLRLLGFYRQLSPASLPLLTGLAVGAFATNFVTGLLFFIGNTYKYIDNAAFETKLALILIAGLNALYFRFRLRPLVGTESVTTASRIVGGLSLLVWAGVIVCGRMITFYAP